MCAEKGAAMNEPVAGLADAIDALRAELAEALRRSVGDSIRFRLRPIELTIQAVVTRGGDGRVGWGVLGLGAKLESASTQLLKLELEPILETPTGSITDFVVTDQGDEEPNFG
jgi:hypothetical protein